MKNIGWIAVLLLLVTAKVGLETRISQKRFEEGLTSRFIFQPAEALNSVVAGGFRGLAADLLWVRVDEYSHLGQWYKLLPLFKMVTFLQPKFITAWSVGGWHMSFNLYFHARAPEDKKKWLEAGLWFLRKGIQANPDRYELYFEAGWTYFYKVKDYPDAIRYLERAVRLEHPQFVEHVLAHAYERGGDFRKSLAVWKAIQARPTRTKSLDNVVNRQIRKLEKDLESAVFFP